MRRIDSTTITTLIGVLMLVVCASTASAATEWTMNLSAEMEGTALDLTYGISGSATDGYDDGLDTNAPLADPSGFDAYFNEPGVGTGKLNADIKALGATKNWTLIVVAPATKTASVSWTSGDLLANVDMQMQELDLSTGEPTGTAIDMKTQNMITVTGGAFAATTKAYRITATGVDATDIVINEFVANPSSGNDWVELYNPTGSNIPLDGWALNDSGSQMKSLSGVINASGYRVFEVGNRLNQDGDTVTLLNGTTVVDEVTYGSQSDNAPVPTTGKSAGRYPNGVDTGNDSADFILFDISTPGAANEMIDTTPPTITANTPTGTDVSVSTVISVTFDEAMNQASAEGAFSIDPSVTGSFIWDGCTMTFTPDAGLVYSTTYNVTIGTIAEDLAGNPLADDFIWEFTTAAHAAPKVSIGSAEGRVGDAVSVSINITGASAIGAMDINITYDPSILSGRDVANGSMIESLSEPQVAYHISSGRINISFATYPDAIDGDGELFIVTFDVIGGDAGDNTTTILEVDAYTTDDPPQPVEVETENGVVNVTGAADTTPPVITAVACDTPTTESVTITWTTDEDSNSLVKYGTETGVYTDNESNTTMVTSHSITLTGLTPETPYYFVVNSTDASGNSNESAEYSFTTEAEAVVTITDWTLDATGTRGTSIDATVNITNTGTETLWFVVSVSGTQAATGYPLVGLGTVQLAAGASIDAPVMIAVPGSADTGDYTLTPVVYRLDEYPAGDPKAIGSGESVTIS